MTMPSQVVLDNETDPSRVVLPELDRIDGPIRAILETYSGIPGDQVIAHVNGIRDKAHEVCPYPCIGLFTFLKPSINSIPQYSEILQRVQAGGKLLDLGSGLGQELRQLVYDGAPAENLIGLDLYQSFHELGCELFQDTDRFRGRLHAADILDGTDDVLTEICGPVAIVHASLFFNVFTREDQLRIARRVVNVVRHKPGGLLVGRISGADEPIFSSGGESGMSAFHHTSETWEQLWRQVQLDTGVQCSLEAHKVPIRALGELAPMMPHYVIHFAVVVG